MELTKDEAKLLCEAIRSCSGEGQWPGGYKPSEVYYVDIDDIPEAGDLAVALWEKLLALATA
jgi:hypothetical protein